MNESQVGLVILGIVLTIADTVVWMLLINGFGK